MTRRGFVSLAIGVVVGALLWGGLADANISKPKSSGTVKACVKRGVVVSGLPSGKCPAGAKKVPLRRGPAGPAGPPGPAGSAGAATAAGASSADADANVAATRHFRLAATDPGDPIDILAIGTSLTEGKASSSLASTWTGVLQRELRQRYAAPAPGGEGYVPAYYAVENLKPLDRFKVVSGVVTTSGTQYGIGRRSLTMSTGGVVEFTFEGTGLDLEWVQQASNTRAAFSWSVDGSPAVAISASVGGVSPSNDGETQIRQLAPGRHVLRLVRISGSPVIGGAMVYDGDETSGVHVWNAGHSGWTSRMMAEPVGSSSVGQYSYVRNVDPDLVMIELGANDMRPSRGISPDQMVSNLDSIVQQVRAAAPSEPDFVVVGTWALVGGEVTEDLWPAYHQALRSYALRQGIGFLDLSVAFGTNSQATASGLLADGTHVTDAGAALWAQKALEILD